MTKVARVAGFAVLAGWVLFAAWYALSPAPPADFTNDLGADVLTIGRMGAMATSPGAIVQMTGWQTWYDNASFVYAPMGQYAIALPLELIVRDPFRTVKILQVVQLSVAFSGAAWLFAAMFGSTRWRWFAGAAYALVPLTTFDVRGNSGIGWIAALVPVVLAVALWLGRRYGARGLPLAGVACSAATTGFSVEHGILTGVPLLAITIALYWRARVPLPWWSVAGALLGFALFPAYVVFATLFAAHLFAWNATDLLNFHTSADMGMFAQGVTESVAGILRESLLSANAVANASGSMPLAIAGGCVLWVFVAAAVYAAARAGSWRGWLPIALVGAACALLSFGARLPALGAFIWDALAWVPVVDAIRTPDRFAQVDALLVALAAAYGARELARRARAARVVCAIGAVLVVGAYLAVDTREHVLGFGSLADRLPAFDRIDAAARQAGGRTAVFAVPNQGSMFDYPPYAMRTPTVSFAWDVYGRYADGDAGVPLLRRAAVASIATTPAWTMVDRPPGVPLDFATPVARSDYARRAFAAPEGPGFFTVDRPRSFIEPEYAVCTFAGPAAFELAAGDAHLDAAALVHGEHPGCVRSVLFDYDPLDANLQAAAVATWSGVGSFGLGYPLGTPNVFQVDRFSLATPWFRDAYLGDSILSREPFVTGDDAVSSPLTFSVAKPGAYALFVRLSGFARLRAVCDGAVTSVAPSLRATGFAWVSLPLGKLAAGAHSARIEMNRTAAFNDAFVVDTVTVAPQNVEAASSSADAVDLSARSFAPPLHPEAETWTSLFPWTRTAGALPPAIVTLRGNQTLVPGDTPEIRSDAPAEPIDFRWNGPSGQYLFSAAGGLGAPYSTMTVSAGGERYTARYAEGLPVGLYGIFNLRHGESIRVMLRSWDTTEKLLEHLILVPVARFESPTNYDTSGEQWRFDALIRPIAFVEAAHDARALVRDGALRAPQATTVSIPILPDLRGGVVTAQVVLPTPAPVPVVQPAATSAPAPVPIGEGWTELRCGNSVDSDSIGPGTINDRVVRLGVKRSGSGPCSLRLRWTTENFAVQSVDVRAFGGTLAGWSAQKSFPAGRYAWSSREGPAPQLEVDGRPWPSGQTISLRGSHRLTLANATVPVPSIRIERAGAWPLPSNGVRGTLELAQLNDGNWFSKTGNGRTAGYDCDLVNTCFDVSGTDEPSIGRRLPPALSLGLAITLADVLAALLIAFAGRRRYA